jgi:hypothetical protein
MDIASTHAMILLSEVFLSPSKAAKNKKLLRIDVRNRDWAQPCFIREPPSNSSNACFPMPVSPLFQCEFKSSEARSQILDRFGKRDWQIVNFGFWRSPKIGVLERSGGHPRSN